MSAEPADPAADAPSQQRIDEVRAQVQTWLLGEGWRLTEKNLDGALWLLEAQDSAGRHLAVGQRQGRPDQIVLEGAVGIAPQHRTRFEELDAAARQDLLWDLRFRLLGLGVEFQGVEEPLTRVMVAQRIYFDGLTKDRFLQRVSQVRNGIIAVIWSVARRLQLEPGVPGSPEAGTGGPGVN